MATPLQSTSAEPTERSICPVMMTSAMPSAIVPTMTVFWLARIAVMWPHLNAFPFASMVKEYTSSMMAKTKMKL